MIRVAESRADLDLCVAINNAVNPESPASTDQLENASGAFVVVSAGDGEAAPGIVELVDEHLRGAYDLAAECLPEMALPQHAEAAPFDERLAEEERGSAGAFVALDGDEVVGCARPYAVPAVPGRLENGLTAVRKSHRRRGIATALERAEIACAAARGHRELATPSVAGNAAMRAVNQRLGYEPLPLR